MKKNQRVLCMMIALLLCLSCMAVVPFAEEGEPADGKYWRVGEEGSGNTYATLQEALNADSTGNGATIYLLADGYSWSRTELLGKNVVIDCQEHTIGGVVEIRDTKKSGSNAGSALVKNMKHVADASDGRTAQLGEAKMITFENCSFTNALKPQYGMFIVAANLTMNNCTVIAETADGAYPMIRPLNAAPTINIHGCTMEHCGSGAVFANFTAKTKLNITDSKLTCNKQGWVINCAANADITIGGTSEVVSNAGASRPAILLTSGTITVDGGTYTASQSAVLQVRGATGIVKGGTFIQKSSSQPVMRTDRRANLELVPGIVLSGGNLICQVEDTTETSIRYPEGVEMPYTLRSPDDMAVEQGKVCRIGNPDDGVYFDHLSDAVKAVPADGTLTRIILIVDQTLADTENLDISGKNIVVEGLGKTINGTLGITGDGTIAVQDIKLTGGDTSAALVTLTGGNVTFEQCEMTAVNGSAFAVEQTAELTLRDTAVNGSATDSALIEISADNGALCVEDSALTADGEVIHAVRGIVNVHSGTVLSSVHGAAVVSVGAGAAVNYFGGTTQSASAADGSVLLQAEQDATVNVFYGTFQGARALSNISGLSYAGGTNEISFLSETNGSSLRAVVDSFGIRFTSTVSAALINNAEAMKNAGRIKAYSFGTLICDSSKLGDSLFTIDALTAANIHFKDIQATPAGSVTNADGSVTFHAALVNVKMANSKLRFAAVSYVVYTLADDTLIYVYGEFDPEKNIDSMENLCREGLLNVQQTQTTVNGVPYYHAVTEIYEISEITGSLKKLKGNAYSCYSAKQLAKMKNYI